MNGWPASIDSNRPGTPATDSIPRLIASRLDAERLGRERGADRVLPVEGAAEAQLDPVERVRGGVEGDRVGQLGREPLPPLALDVHDGPLGLGEECRLRLVVGLHRPVEVEVVLGQVREHEHRERRPLETALRARLRGRLEHAGAVAGVGHLAQEPLEVDRLGRVQPGRPLLAADAPLDVREQARRPSGRLEDRLEQERRRRLPVRAGDAGDLELAGRVAEEETSRDRHRRANVGHDELGQLDVERVVDDERGRPERRRRRGEGVAVRVPPAHAEEERARADGACVVGEIARSRPSPARFLPRRRPRPARAPR